ncbi:MAG TPA: FAD/NAD(P)-binding oxidoreductase [Isosphaeraceae bacterium]|jgi:NADPH-dependent 2,4-dienoyl-CoA reductase/sulfur reductase-like enzyme
MPSDPAFDILVVGSGPAGMAAAVGASARGKAVGVVDDNPSHGGQIWRNGAKEPPSREAARWLDRVRTAGFETFTATQVLGPLGPRLLLAESEGQAIEIRYERLIVATGARELFLPFPGWTLPNVMGAGGLQAMVKSGMPIEGTRVVVAGSGPLLLAVAACLRKLGAKVPLVAEQAPFAKVAGFGLGLWREPKKIAQVLVLGTALGRVPFRAGCWPVAAEGDGALESVTMTDGSKTWRERCDYLACGFGLVPNVELAGALGCATHHGVVGVDALQRTTVPDVFAAGEVTGIGGLDRSLVEGEIAGLAASGDEAAARFLFPARDRAHRFARRLERAFGLRDELRRLPRPETIVCRCEDVAHGSLAPYSSWTEAKLQTRCGMGPCQGRVCGAAAEVLYGWTRTSIRPPIFPTALGHLAGRGPAA